MLRTFVLRFACVLLPFVILDALWLGVIAPGFYQAQLGEMLLENPNWYAAAGFYLIFLAGLVVFVVTPATEQRHTWTKVMTRGAFFGVVTYATYDLTNLATLRNWPVIMTLVDLVWGAVICSVSSLVAVRLMRTREKD